MSGRIPALLRDPETPEEVILAVQPRAPEEDPTLGIGVVVERAGVPPHRLVTIGDSVTQGFQSGAIYNTDLSYPAILAHELGWARQFRFPRYDGPGGLPLNIELLLRELEDRFGPDINVFELPLALFRARQFMDQVEDYWERGPGMQVPALESINHNLGVYGWDLRDCLDRTFASSQRRLEAPNDDFLDQIVQDHNLRAAMRVLPSIPAAARELTVFDAARQLGDEGGGDVPGIETLVVMLGSNNALGTVTSLQVRWSGPGFDDLDRKGAYTIWRPSHFQAELDRVVAEVRQIRARHVIWGTVPHVTIPPVTRGVADKVEPGSPYFPYYTRPWIADRDFDPRRDRHLTDAQALAIDSAIDQYNTAITAAVRQARQDQRDWYLVDVAGILDRLASRRYIDDPLARPSWWQPYALPPSLQVLRPVPDSRFLTVGADGGRATGGLFSLDGVHPTTIGYGVLAQEVMNVMHRAGVTFFHADGSTPRPDPLTVDFPRLVRRDTLVTAPPRTLTAGLRTLRWADETLDLFGRTLPFAG